MPEERQEHAPPPVYTFAEYTLDTGRGSLSNTGADYLANLRIERAIYESDRLGRRLLP